MKNKFKTKYCMIMNTEPVVALSTVTEKKIQNSGRYGQNESLFDRLVH